MAKKASQAGTSRERILEAGAAVLAARGYNGARIREICRVASVNVAAINYYFGGKRGLYEAVLQHAFYSLPGAEPSGWPRPRSESIDRRLAEYVRRFLTQVLSGGRPARLVKLILRELIDPTPALHRIIDLGMRPQVEAMEAIVRDALPASVDRQSLRRTVNSIIGQCLYYAVARPVVTRLGMERPGRAPDIDGLAAHITAFSLGALRGLGASRQSNRARRLSRPGFT